jgi:hypothetical protein
MPQPANKRFVMEDKLTTELALKATIANPTFTGTINTGTGGIFSNGNIYADGDIDSTGTILSNSTTAITNSSSTHAVQAGPTSGLNVRLGTDGTNAAVQAVNNGVYSNLDVNVLGGNVDIGSASTTTSVLGTFTPPRGFMLAQRFVYTSSPANFTKATYPWLRAIKVICVGGGGGGGGAATTAANQNALGAAGSGAAIAETFITDIASLGASIAITVGGGGAGGAAGNNAGINGGASSFGSLCIAANGAGGVGSAATAIGTLGAGTNANDTASSTGDIIYLGTGSGARQFIYATFVMRPQIGGSSIAAGARVGQAVTGTGVDGAAPSGTLYGSGGHAGVNAQSQTTARAGGAGAGGLVIVELYA